jgi:hypothetical protein
MLPLETGPILELANVAMDLWRGKSPGSSAAVRVSIANNAMYRKSQRRIYT